ncbi:putative CxxxxCH...CXXCH cytochrome family protein [Geothermobacter ehrlichii]|uniref:Putative CxxxxCH...CXXCH cytochrome family protein n=1 Tax=Geothermobacter ehrlichii TaxID=213224 RepID=A0A5D3WKR3_9BACT|nr:putative CxxxxCH...CXXCH cytochrome family protein [Geothermobacter ehrlichii]
MFRFAHLAFVAVLTLVVIVGNGRRVEAAANCATYGFATDGFNIAQAFSYKTAAQAGWETMADSTAQSLDGEDDGTDTNDCDLMTSDAVTAAWKLKIKDKGTGGSNIIHVNTGVATGQTRTIPYLIRIIGSDEKGDGTCGGKQMWSDFNSITVYNYDTDNDNVVTTGALTFSTASIITASGTTSNGCNYEIIEFDVSSLYDSSPQGVFNFRIVPDDGATDNTEVKQLAEIYQQYAFAPPCSATAPTDLAAGVLTPTSVPLSWSSDCANSDTYTVYRDGVALAAGTNLTCSAGTMNFTDNTAAANTTYDYTVRGYNNGEGCESADSNTVNVTTPPCTESTPSSISFNGTTTAAGDFNGSSMVNVTDLTNLEFRVTEGAGAGAVTFDAQSNLYQPAGGATMTWQHTIGGGTDRLLLVGVAFDDRNGETVTSVTYNGIALTQLRADNTATSNARTELWYLKDASLPAAGTYDVVVTLSTASGKPLYGGALTYSGVDQTATFTSHNGASGNADPATVDITSQAGDLVVDIVVGYKGAGLAVGAGQTAYWVENTDALGAVIAGMSYEAGAATTTMSWTGAGDGGEWSISAVSIHPGAGETIMLDWNADPQEASAVLTDGSSYNLYARGTDPECGTVYYVGGTTAPGNSQSFTWTACTETATLSAPTFSPSTTPITGPVTVSASGTATGIQVSWSEDGGTTWSAWVANGSTYTPTSCTTGNVIFRAQGTGTCGTLTSQGSATAFDTTDADLATLTTTVPDPATGMVTIQAAVGTESAPDTMANMVVNIAGSSACNVTNGTMSWNATSSRWEYSWDTSACGTSTVESGVTIDVSGNDPDCGDAVSAAQVTVSIDNTCVDPDPSTITIPNGQSVSGSSVDLTTLFTVTGDVGNFTYTINGTAVTSPWDSTAYGTTGPEVVTFEVTGIDPDCGDTVGPVSNSITVNNANDTNVSNVTADSKDASIRVQASYSGDVNGDNTLLVEWEECTGGVGTCDGSTFTNSSGTIAHASSPYIYDITGLTNFKVYQVRVTFTDVDGVSGTNPTVITDVVPSNPMLHNAASTGSSKWGGTWGLPGGKYGEFTCDTCHTDTTTNIKRVKETISYPDGSVMPNGSTSSAVTLSDTRDGSSDYGDAVGSHASSTGVCEVCHTLDETQTNGVQHHAYDMSTATPANQNHYLQQDCMVCHNHKAGFLPTACDACHGDPPTTSDTDGSTNTGLVHTDVTGSTTPGAHDTHVNTLGFNDCATCHNGYVMPNGGDIDVHFNVDFTASGGGGPATAGSYGGQLGVNYNGGTPGDGTKACSNVYCHGGTIGGSAPVWDGTVVCGDCHGASAATPPATGSHAVHVPLSQINGDCTKCHGAGAGSQGHMNGNVTWDVSALPNTGSTATYKGTTTGATGGLAPSASYGTCSNVSCHFGTTPTWGQAGSTDCASCHNNGAGEPWPATGAHDAHFAALGVSLAASVGNEAAVRAKCDYCHNGASASHADGTVQVNIAATYDDMSAGTPAFNGSQCSDVSCHGGQTTPAWSSGTIDVATQCTLCHKAEATATEYNSATSGMHGITGVVSGQNHGANIACTSCHSGPPANHFSDAGLADSAMSRPVAGDFVAGITLGATSDDDTCAMTCHKEGATNPRSGSAPWARLNNKAWASGTGAAGDECKTCHGVWGSWRGNVLVNHANDWDGDGTPEVQANHSECETCHGFAPSKTNANYNATWGTGDHGNGVITMNGPSPSTGAGYNETNWGCDNACHGGAASNHNLADSTWTVGYGDFGGGSCDLCHAPGGSGPTVVYPAGNSGFAGELYGSHLKASTGDVIDGTTDWAAQCQKCHGFHSGDVQVPNNATVGINYTSHGGIWLGGTATGGMTTEAEICWTCHDANGVSEWGLNTDTNGAYPNFNFGTLSTSNWTTATWTSANFGYKTGAIQSTHSVNATNGSSAVTGSAYNYTESPDNVADIRCSYCHDVHNTAAAGGVTGDVDGKPYLRGTWFGNPYFEDGAPQNINGTTTFETITQYGRVPRGSINEDFFDANGNAKGGYWIDQNMNAQGVGTYPVNTTLANMAGLCTLCHGTNVDSMDQTTGENLWVGINGHSNAVIGGSGSNKTEILDRSKNDINNKGYVVDMGQSGDPNQTYDRPEGYGYRDSGDYTPGYAPRLIDGNPAKEQEPWKNKWFDWGVSARFSGDTYTQYHQFTCSKCHNPHASRLPKLMITNCLDTKHNTWQNAVSVDDNSPSVKNGAATATPTRSDGWHASNWSTSQNCHRVGIPGELGTGDGLGDMDGQGWNKVTPW